MDVKSSFLNGVIKEEVNVKQPKFFKDPYFPDNLMRLKKTSYWLNIASHAWYE